MVPFSVRCSLPFPPFLGINSQIEILMKHDGILLGSIPNLSKSKIKVTVSGQARTQDIRRRSVANLTLDLLQEASSKSYSNLLSSVNWEEFFHDIMTPNEEGSIVSVYKYIYIRICRICIYIYRERERPYIYIYAKICI